MQYFNYYLDVWKKYAVFSGRASRSEYWYFLLFNIIVSIILSVATHAIRLDFIYTLYALATILPSIAVGIRRLHDTDRSGWWLLICFVPIIGALVLLYFAIQEGTAGSNQYGPAPKDGMSSGSTTPSSDSNPAPTPPVTPTA